MINWLNVLILYMYCILLVNTCVVQYIFNVTLTLLNLNKIVFFLIYRLKKILSFLYKNLRKCSAINKFFDKEGFSLDINTICLIPY